MLHDLKVPSKAKYSTRTTLLRAKRESDKFKDASCMMKRENDKSKVENREEESNNETETLN